MEEEEEKTYSKKVDMKCTTDKNEVRLGESLKISCIVTNQGNTILKSLNVCAEDVCRTIELGIGQQRTADLEYTPQSVGKKSLTVIAKNAYVSKSVSLFFNVLDAPGIKMDALNFPAEMRYGEEYTIEFILDKKSFSNPANVSILLYKNKIMEEWAVGELIQDKKMRLDLVADDLYAGKNDFNLIIQYYDNQGMEYTESNEFAINLVEVSFLEHIKLWFNRVNAKIDALFR